jgi:hypothetical protein
MKDQEINLREWLDIIGDCADGLDTLAEAVDSAHDFLKRKYNGAALILPRVPKTDAEEMYAWCEEEGVVTDRSELS